MTTNDTRNEVYYEAASILDEIQQELMARQRVDWSDRRYSAMVKLQHATDYIFRAHGPIGDCSCGDVDCRGEHDHDESRNDPDDNNQPHLSRA